MLIDIKMKKICNGIRSQWQFEKNKIQAAWEPNMAAVAKNS